MVIQLNTRKRPGMPPPPSQKKPADTPLPPSPPLPSRKKTVTFADQMEDLTGGQWDTAAPKREVMAPRDALTGTVQGTNPWRRVGAMHSTTGDLITMPLFAQHAPFGVTGEYNYAVGLHGATHIVAEHSVWLKDGAAVTFFDREFKISMEESFRQFPNLVAVV